MHFSSRRSRPPGLALRAGVAALALTATGVGTAHAQADSISSAKPSHAATKTSAPATAAAQSVRTQALQQAHTTDKAVPIPSATTAYSTLTAEPNGQLELTNAVSPQRTQVDGSWKTLNATLTKHTNGTWSPEVASEGLTISGGGRGPLATMTRSGYGMALTLPSSIPTLPAPKVSGDTATYTDVLPGVDLIVTVNDTGGFSEVFEVENAAAAANPALATLTFGTKTTGKLTVAADKSGNLTAATDHGVVLFAAPSPTMWDSATSASIDSHALTDPRTGTKLDRSTGNPIASSAIGPGAAAHTARLGVSTGHGSLTLSVDKAMLASKSTIWPAYIDPTWSTTGGDANNWTYTSSEFPTATHWDLPTSSDYLHVGYIDSQYDTDGYTSNDISYFQYNLGALSSLLSGSTVNDVWFYTDDVWSDSCTAELTDLYSTGKISPSTSAGDAPAWGSQLQRQSFAYGGTGCAASQDVAWNSTNLTDLVQNQVSGGISSSTTLTLALRADDESDPLTWRKFDQNTAVLTIYFDQAPNTPTAKDMSTSPYTPCASSLTDAVGLGPMKLYTYVSSRMGNQNPLEYEFELWKTSGGSNSSPLYTVGLSSSLTTANDSFASTLIPASDFAKSTWAGNLATEFSWRVLVSDGLASSNWSPTCNFYYDPSIPGQPSFTDDSTQCSGNDIGSTEGTAVTFPVTPNADASAPTSYQYQLNTNAPGTVAANGSNGTGSITVTPTRRVNVLTVTPLSIGGNVGLPATCQFIVDPAPDAVDRDMNDDSIPDLLTTGQTAITSTNPGTAPYAYTTDTSSDVPAGLYLADGTPDSAGTAGTGQVQTNATDIGTAGNGTTGTSAPESTFNGEEVITGSFTHNGFQDILAYDPADSGTGQIIQGNGDGQDLNVYTGSQLDILSGSLQDADGYNPAQLVDAYAAASSSNSYDTTYPDLLGISGTTGNYYLEYYLSGNGEGDFGFGGSGAAQLTNDTPDGTMDWQNWVLTSTQISGETDLILWEPTSGELCLWNNAALSNASIDTDINDYGIGYGYGTGTLTYTGSTTTNSASYPDCGEELAHNDFETGTELAALEAANVTGSGIPSVWAVTPNGATSAMVSTTTFSSVSTSTTATMTSQTPQQLETSTTHAWDLNDEPDGTATSAADASGSLDLTASGAGAIWNTGSTAYIPDIKLDGAADGTLSAASGAIVPDDSWSVDAWADPTTENTTVWSQSGKNYPLIALSTTSSDTWELSVNTSTDGSTGNYDVIAGGNVNLNEWTELTTTYDTDTNILTLYADGNEISVTRDATVATASNGSFVLGAQQAANSSPTTLSRYYSGQLANIRTWNTAVPPTTANTLGSDYVPVTPARIMDTRENGTSGNPREGSTLGPVSSDSTTTVPIEGSTVNGADIPSTGVTAVAVSITLTGQTQVGFLTVYPDGTPIPVTSTLNFNGDTVTNAAIVPVGTDGDIAIYNGSSGTAQLIIDVTGYYTTTTTAANASTYQPLADPTRILDTRSGLGAAEQAVPSDSSITLTVAGNTTAGIPADTTGAEITAVAINLTAVSAPGSGTLTAYPDGDTSGATATTSLSYTIGDAIAASLVIPVGNDGKIVVYNNSPTAVNVVGDAFGYYTTAATGQMFHALSSTRLLDTRRYNPNTGTASPAASETTIYVTAPTAIDADNPTLVLNATVTDGTQIGTLNIYPHGQIQPTASAINWSADETVANLNVAAATSDNEINIYNNSTGTVDIIIDTDGYFD